MMFELSVRDFCHAEQRYHLKFALKMTSNEQIVSYTGTVLD